MSELSKEEIIKKMHDFVTELEEKHNVKSMLIFKRLFDGVGFIQAIPDVSESLGMLEYVREFQRSHLKLHFMQPDHQKGLENVAKTLEARPDIAKRIIDAQMKAHEDGCCE